MNLFLLALGSLVILVASHRQAGWIILWIAGWTGYLAFYYDSEWSWALYNLVLFSIFWLILKQEEKHQPPRVSSLGRLCVEKGKAMEKFRKVREWFRGRRVNYPAFLVVLFAGYLATALVVGIHTGVKQANSIFEEIKVENTCDQSYGLREPCRKFREVFHDLSEGQKELVDAWKNYADEAGFGSREAERATRRVLREIGVTNPITSRLRGAKREVDYVVHDTYRFISRLWS